MSVGPKERPSHNAGDRYAHTARTSQATPNTSPHRDATLAGTRPGVAQTRRRRVAECMLRGGLGLGLHRRSRKPHADCLVSSSDGPPLGLFAQTL